MRDISIADLSRSDSKCAAAVLDKFKIWGFFAMFIALASLSSGCSTTPSADLGPDDVTPSAPGAFRIHPRYVRLFTDAGIEQAESNYKYAKLDWEIPVNRAAVLCIDCWAWHFSSDTQQRIDETIQNHIAPLLAACREKGLQIIHAPADPVASRSPNLVRMKAKDARPQPQWPDSPVWPPQDFRDKTGFYAPYARPKEPQADYRNHHRENLRDFHPLCRPVNEEAVIIDGEDLHRLCARRGILFLFVVGFNTNACVMMRNYGIPAMSERGYEMIIVRDCTTGMESAATVGDLTDTKGAIDTIEQHLGCSITSEELIRSLQAVRKN